MLIQSGEANIANISSAGLTSQEKSAFAKLIGHSFLPLAIVLGVLAVWFYTSGEAGINVPDMHKNVQLESYTSTIIEHLVIFGHGYITAIVVASLALLGKHKQAQDLTWALIFTLAVVYALKFGVGRIRPNGRELSFPSADVATAVVTLAPFLLMRKSSLPAFCIVLVVMFKRSWGGYHYPSDTCAGAAIALVIYAITQQFSHKLPAVKSQKFWEIFLGLSSAALVVLAFFNQKAYHAAVVAVPVCLVAYLVYFLKFRPAQADNSKKSCQASNHAGQYESDKNSSDSKAVSSANQ